MVGSFYELSNSDNTVGTSEKNILNSAASVLNVVKIFDPSGIAGIISAFLKENCFYDSDFTPLAAVITTK